MTNYYSNSIDYHDDLDRFEARARAEQEETEIHETEKPMCVCLVYIGDNGPCPVHGENTVAEYESEGSDTSMGAQLSDAGYRCGGIF